MKKQAITGPRRAYANDVAESLAMVLGNRRGSIQEWADRITLARQDVQKFVMLDGARVAAGDVEALPAEEHVGYHLDRLERQAKQTRDPAILGAIRQGAQQLLAKIDRLTSRAAASVPQESVNELALVSGAEQGDVLQKAAVLLRGAPTRAQLLDLRAEVIEARDSDERLLQKLNAEIAALPEDAT